MPIICETVTIFNRANTIVKKNKANTIFKKNKADTIARPWLISIELIQVFQER